MSDKLSIQPGLIELMTHKKAVEILTEFEHRIWWKDCADLKVALRMAKVALISEELGLDLIARKEG